ncbi:MAG TPA: YciI family protein [Candidatus Polarisedimenticolia bacterium]|jgi:uncharacterized protein YciI|nr:YciI family protein [Candidatus Polarisedimenticolia bacterium]
MRSMVLALALSLMVLASSPARSAAPAPPAPAAAPAAPHADPMGYEMTTYYVGLLYRGPSWSPEDTPEHRRIQEGHLANIKRLADEGKLILAGPFSDDGDLRGMFVFLVGSLQEAKALVDTDPAVQAGRLRVELHPWFSAKGINVPKPAPKP